MELFGMDLGTIVTLIISALTMFFGGFWLKAKGNLTKITQLIKEIFDLVDAFNDALKDDKIDKKELEKIKTEFNELKKVFNDLFSKEVK